MSSRRSAARRPCGRSSSSQTRAKRMTMTMTAFMRLAPIGHAREARPSGLSRTTCEAVRPSSCGLLRGARDPLQSFALVVRETPFQNRLPRARGQVEQETEIMQAQEPQPEQLALVDEMAQVGAREALAGGARAILGQRPRVAREPRVLQVEATVLRERGPGAPQPRRPDAVEEVDPALDDVEDPGGVADAHEVARPVRRQEGCRPGRGLEHLAPLLP